MNKEQIQKVKEYLKLKSDNIVAKNMLKTITELEINDFEKNKNLITSIIEMNISKHILDKIL
ncbi:hypothetical protein [uncultured Brachyspira sp.]|uniref:hypothetical protein n=1 Tax=uncultured Brachyspira sp. TaxID=221953 RepID=UPI0026174CD1|nr:hypothetical protein [uncultured Brachyspira sp.]